RTRQSARHRARRRPGGGRNRRTRYRVGILEAGKAQPPQRRGHPGSEAMLVAVSERCPEPCGWQRVARFLQMPQVTRHDYMRVGVWALRPIAVERPPEIKLDGGFRLGGEPLRKPPVRGKIPQLF